MGVPEKNCPKYVRIMQKYLKSEAYQKIYNKHKKLFEYITEKSGKVVNSTYGVSELLFTLSAEVFFVHFCMSKSHLLCFIFVQDQNGKRLPNWTKTVYPDAMVEASADEYHRRAATKELMKLGSGTLTSIKIT